VILLLDAHALLWWLADDPSLSPEARRGIADPANDVLVSAATVWEIEIKRALGKLAAPDGIVAAADAVGFGSLPITSSDAQRAAHLPMHHRDPFDRMLVAQAQRLAAAIVTRDRWFDAYEVDVLSASTPSGAEAT
jgi:PIN domain nuclease of toxin-antitoxin system